jgi:spore germination protein
MRSADYHRQQQKAMPLDKPKLTVEQAKQELAKNFEVSATSRAVIESEMGGMVPCYQFFGKINGGNYKVFINSDTGYEEKVENVQ